MQKQLWQWITPTTWPTAWMAGAAIAISPTVAYAPAAHAQVTSATDGTGTRVFRNGNLFNIRGGTQAGTNLFHNFESLNIESNQTVNFLPDSNVLNIVGQVSGSDPSYIEGQLQVQAGSDANLYLINPQGVLFGPDAQLSLSGSFTAATADQVGFNGAWLDVLQTDSDYTKLTAPPSAFRFTAASAGAVVNQGDLSVQAGESLTLIGGNVVSEGRLAAPGGEIGLVTVGGESTVRFGVPGSLLSLEIAKQDFGGDASSSFSPTDLPALLTGESGAGTDAASTDLVVTPDNRVLLTDTSVEPEEVVVTGSVSTSSSSADGGIISLAGRSIDVLSATVEASGNNGGTIRIGSDSASGNLPASRLLLLRDNPIVQAQGRQGSGGNIVISATNTSIEAGTISARGETQGGLIETSATQGFKVIDAAIDASGQAAGGRWLLNPPGVSITDDASNPKRIHSAAIERALDAGTNVEIDAADRDISLLRSINQVGNQIVNQTGNRQADLTLRTRRFIADGPTINLASTGQLSFDINPHNQLGGSSVQSAIASIGNVRTRPLLNLGAATYDFSNPVVIAKDVDIVGATAGETIFNASRNNRVFDVSLGATATLTDLTFTTADSLLDSDLGGGIDNAGTLSVNNVIFEDNRGLFGGALHNKPSSVLTVANSEFTNNSADREGGAIFNQGTASFAHSLLASNRAIAGGAVANFGTLEAVNVTISGNRARDEGGGIKTVGAAANLTLSNATLSNNSAGRLGGGIRELNAQSTQLLNTIVAENQSAVATDVSGRFIDEGGNLIGQSDGATGFTRSSLVGAATSPLDPKLSPLADNGGLNRTHLLQADSPAINAGTSDFLPERLRQRLLVVDQRGFDRVVGAAVDIGAVETTATEVPPELLETVSPNLPDFVIAATPIPAIAALPPAALNAALPAISQLSVASTDDSENKNILLPTSAETQTRADDVAIRKVESTFSQSYQDYWNMPIQDDLSFQQVQSVLRRAQDEYQVNSAVIYAAFTPAEAPIERREDILRSKAMRSDDDLLQLLLVMPTGELVTHHLPVTRKEADRQVRLFRSNVADPEDSFGYRPLAQQFYHWLLAPLEADLAAQGVQNLLYSLDEGLRTVPVAAMHDDDGYLLERYGISVIPTMGLMRTDFSARVRRSTVAMGVAEFDRQAPLPAVPVELDFVKNFIPAATTTLNEGTTLAALQSVQTLVQPGVLHLATHADFDARSPESSAIHLWENPLSMAEFKDLDWDSADLEMLILSACVTALSSPNSELGFAGLAAASGVDATVGSLWQVSDTGTLALMSEFYIQLENTGLRFEALRKAQLSLLNGETRIQNGNLLTSQGEIDLPDAWNLPDNAALDHPFYWSAFTMVGNPW